MRYYKMTDAEGNMTAIGTGAGGTKISVSTSLRFRAGITYHYVLYDWEET